MYTQKIIIHENVIFVANKNISGILSVWLQLYSMCKCVQQRNEIHQRIVKIPKWLNENGIEPNNKNLYIIIMIVYRHNSYLYSKFYILDTFYYCVRFCKKTKSRRRHQHWTFQLAPPVCIFIANTENIPKFNFILCERQTKTTKIYLKSGEEKYIWNAYFCKILIIHNNEYW